MAPSGQLHHGRAWAYRPRMADELSERYRALLSGSYDCVDRIVLSAWSLANSAGGFRLWWRRLHHDSEAELDNTHLMRLAGRFSRRLRASAKSTASR